MTIDPYAVDTPADEYHERQHDHDPATFNPWFTPEEAKGLEGMLKEIDDLIERNVSEGYPR